MLNHGVQDYRDGRGSAIVASFGEGEKHYELGCRLLSSFLSVSSLSFFVCW